LSELYLISYRDFIVISHRFWILLHFILGGETLNLHKLNFNMKIKSIILVIVLLFSVKAFSNEINFVSGTYAEVLAKAKAENKIVMIDFFTDWCKWCVELDKKVYTVDEVANFANEKQVNWKIDAEKGEGIELAKKFGVSGYPTVLFVNGDGEEIDRIVGYFPAKEFLALMKDYNEGKNTMKGLKTILKINPDDVDTNFRLGKKTSDAGNMEEAKMYFDKVVALDPNNKNGLTDDAELYLAQIKNTTADIEAFIKKYPESNMVKQAYMFLADASMEANDVTKADGYYKLLFEKYGKSDEEVSFAYGQYLLGKIYLITKKEKLTKDDNDKGIKLANECIEYVKGGVNEASCYYYLSIFYVNNGDKAKANESIDKAIKIFDRKTFRDQKEKINK
jgi:thioredoxin-related protein